MRGKKLLMSVMLTSALTAPFLMPVGAQAQLLDLSGVLGTDGAFSGGGLLGVGGVDNEGGLLNSVLRDAVLLNNCGLPLLSGGCRAFSDDISDDDIDFDDIDVRFRRSPIFIIDDGRKHDGRKHDGRHHRCFIEPWLCGHDGKRFHDGRFHDGRFHDGRFHDPCCFDDRFHSTPFVTHVPVHTVPVGGQSFVSNNNNNNNNNNITVVGGGGGGASSSASSSSSS